MGKLVSASGGLTVRVRAAAHPPGVRRSSLSIEIPRPSASRCSGSGTDHTEQRFGADIPLRFGRLPAVRRRPRAGSSCSCVDASPVSFSTPRRSATSWLRASSGSRWMLTRYSIVAEIVRSASWLRTVRCSSMSRPQSPVARATPTISPV